MREGKNSNLVRQHTVIDGVWKAWHEVMPDIRLDDAPPLRGVLDHADGAVDGIEELRTEGRSPLLLELSCLGEFHFSLRVVNQTHPMARRAACMTSSCVRPATAPDESSSSRRTASRTAWDSSVSARPASMLCQSACASETRSGSGSAIASAVSCCVDMAKRVATRTVPVNKGRERMSNANKFRKPKLPDYRLPVDDRQSQNEANTIHLT